MTDSNFDAIWDKITSHIFGQIHKPEAEVLFKRALESNIGCYVEIGAFQGLSTAVLAEAAKISDGGVLSIDPFIPGYEDPGNPGTDAHQEFKKNIFPEYSHYVISIPLTSREALASTFFDPILPGAFIDVLFIDGDHEYEAVKFDIEHFAPLVRSGGYIIFDDYNNHAALPGVKKAVDELLSEWETTDDVWNIIAKRKPWRSY